MKEILKNFHCSSKLSYLDNRGDLGRGISNTHNEKGLILGIIGDDTVNILWVSKDNEKILYFFPKI